MNEPRVLDACCGGRMMQRAAEISECGTYRWSLSRVFGGHRSVCWIMLNPSTADAMKDDPTIKRIIGFSQRWGYGRLEVVNLYPYRSPSPKDLARWLDQVRAGNNWDGRDAIWHNIRFARSALQRADLVMGAWGASCPDQLWPSWFINEVIDDKGIHHLGETLGGDPKHPLARGHHRIPDNQMPIPWKT